MLKRYQTSVTLTEEEVEKVEKLKAKGFKIVDIFRAGLDFLEKGTENRG